MEFEPGKLYQWSWVSSWDIDDPYPLHFAVCDHHFKWAKTGEIFLFVEIRYIEHLTPKLRYIFLDGTGQLCALNNSEVCCLIEAEIGS